MKYILIMTSLMSYTYIDASFDKGVRGERSEIIRNGVSSLNQLIVMRLEIKDGEERVVYKKIHNPYGLRLLEPSVKKKMSCEVTMPEEAKDTKLSAFLLKNNITKRAITSLDSPTGDFFKVEVPQSKQSAEERLKAVCLNFRAKEDREGIKSELKNLLGDIKDLSILNKYNRNGETLVHQISPQADLELIQILRKAGLDITKVTVKPDKYSGSTIAHIWCGILYSSMNKKKSHFLYRNVVARCLFWLYKNEPSLFDVKSDDKIIDENVLKRGRKPHEILGFQDTDSGKKFFELYLSELLSK